jgi:hypothetical protein
MCPLNRHVQVLTPALYHPAMAVSPRPAAVGPGVRPKASAVPGSAVCTCAAVAYKAGFWFYPLLSTNDGEQRGLTGQPRVPRPRTG